MKKPSAEEETQQLSKLLQSLKQASHELQSNSNSPSAIKALLELQTESSSSDNILFIFTTDPHLSNLFKHLSNLKTIKESSQLCHYPHHRLTCFLTRRVNSHEICKLASSIESDIQAWFDHQTLTNLISNLQRLRVSGSLMSIAIDEYEESSLIKNLDSFISCLTHGFDIKLQDTLLKSNVFEELEYALVDESLMVSQQVREKVAYSLKSLVLFNKDVFVGRVLMGEIKIIKALIKIGTLFSLQVLQAFIKAIKSPLVDELESFGGLTKIVEHLCSIDTEVKLVALDCLLEIGYYGRKEAIEALLNSGLIEKLMNLQRMEIEFEGDHNYNHHSFASCVSRFAVQLEVGEGLRQREKRAFKQEILKRVKEASLSDAEAATVISEVLWGSSP